LTRSEDLLDVIMREVMVIWQRSNIWEVIEWQMVVLGHLKRHIVSIFEAHLRRRCKDLRQGR
jgi:hypothetical protein